jgi:tripartite-type tricarboxylate transporter receptor subunit TctC
MIGRRAAAQHNGEDALTISRLLATCGVACLVLIGQLVPASAEPGYPRKSIRIVVPFAPGGTADIVARTVAQEATKPGTPWQFYVENITGAGGMVGAQAAARASADGYTLLLCHIACAAGHLLSGAQGFDPTTAFVPIVLVGSAPNILVAGPSIQAKNLAEFLTLARARPGQLSMASSGPGSSSHLSGELLRVKAGIDLLDVPYRGSSGAMPDLLSGRVDTMVMGFAESLPYVRDGKLKAFGVTTEKRAPSLPDVPTIAEAGVPGYAYDGWLSLFAPVGTPAEIVTLLNGVFDTAIRSPAVTRSFGDQSIQAGGGPPKVAADIYRADIELWPSIIRARAK